MEMVNGYVFLDLTKSNVYSKALKVLGTDKPVVIKDGSGSPYFVDSLTLSGTNIIITKGGKTITIANDNTITNVGDIQEKLHLYRLQFQLKIEGTDATFFMLIYSNKGNLTKENVTLEELNQYCYMPIYDDNNNFVNYYFEDFYMDGDDSLECNLLDANSGEVSADSGTTVIQNLTKIF